MRCACIDIGSNTTRVLVAEARDGRLTEVLQRRAFTRIGAGLAADGEISAAKVQEVATVVAEQVNLAVQARARAVRVVATAAIREASNGAALCEAIAGHAGVEVEVLQGAEEARLAFLGATRTLGRELEGVVAVVDVGGGSSEVAVGTVAGGVTWSCSARIGSGLLTDAHLRSDPPAAAELDAVRTRARIVFAELAIPPAACAVAVGGSATSLRRLLGDRVEPDAIERAVQILAAEPCEAVARRFGLDPERVRLMPAGILLLGALSACMGRSLQLGRGGLREGVCLELAG